MGAPPGRASAVSPYANCAQKEMFQAPADVNSCKFSIGIVLTAKPKWDFCVKSFSLVSWRINSFTSARKCVVWWQCDGSEIATILNEFNQSLEGKGNLISCLLSKNTFPPGNFLQQRQRNPTEKRASSCTSSPCRVMFCLLKPISSIFWLC